MNTPESGASANVGVGTEIKGIDPRVAKKAGATALAVLLPLVGLSGCSEFEPTPFQQRAGILRETTLENMPGGFDAILSEVEGLDLKTFTRTIGDRPVQEAAEAMGVSPADYLKDVANKFSNIPEVGFDCGLAALNQASDKEQDSGAFNAVDVALADFTKYGEQSSVLPSGTMSRLRETLSTECDRLVANAIDGSGELIMPSSVLLTPEEMELYIQRNK